ncbi:hypothetical protein [Nitrincola nitratireducens]|uniref:Integrase SAM-like N-terminal domain-containing protein n=1 Tax=Nitrincola nitratireducens TaxID=1229521 RepID=W9UQ09_9GAMM|nr:hypothetical protein [Nitrincola nitratireducens]EXJ09194.1 hypothetical protein D791_03891 [Nitrincola nitratireducens]
MMLAKKTFEDTCLRVERILDAISAQYPKLMHYNQIKLMHCQWYKDVALEKYSEATRLDYIRALRLLVTALGKEHWLSLLKIDTHTGAPSKIGAIKSSKRTVKRVRKGC